MSTIRGLLILAMQPKKPSNSWAQPFKVIPSKPASVVAPAKPAPPIKIVAPKLPTPNPIKIPRPPPTIVKSPIVKTTVSRKTNPNRPSLIKNTDPTPDKVKPPRRSTALHNSVAHNQSRAQYHANMVKALKPHVIKQVASFINDPIKHLSNMNKINTKMAHHQSLFDYHTNKAKELQSS